MIDRETAERFRKRAIYAARKLGFAQSAEDLAQEVLLEFCQGRGRHQTIGQAVIDAVRRKYGRPGLPGHAQRLALENADSIFDEDGHLSVDAPAVEPQKHGIDFNRIITLLRSEQDREILRDFYVEEKLIEEMGRGRGVSGARVSQKIGAAEQRLRSLIERRGMEVGIELETRVCACGCKANFKCLPGSKTQYASALCQQDATGEVPKFTRAKMRRMKAVERNLGMKHSNVAVTEVDEDVEIEDLDQVEEQERPQAEEHEESAAPAAGGHGRFTMTIPEAAETFSLNRLKIYTWIERGYLQVHKESPRKTWVDPSDIGRIIEEGITEARGHDSEQAAPAAETVEDAPQKVEAPRVKRKYTRKEKGLQGGPQAEAQGEALGGDRSWSHAGGERCRRSSRLFLTLSRKQTGIRRE